MNDRQRKILQLVNEQGRVSVADLSERFACSKVTIRNDIRSMAAQGLIERLHGGAMRTGGEELPAEETADGKGLPVLHPISYDSGNLGRKTEEKRRIAAKAYDFIEENDTIILDDSSACYYLAEHISTHPDKRIAVLTNSLPSAVVLSACPHVELYLIGGHVGGHLPATMGEQAVQGFRSVFVDKGFISVHSINRNVGLTSIGTPQMQIKRAIFQTTDKVFVLADSSKFGAGYLEVVCPIGDVYRVVTDNALSGDYVEWVRAEGTEIILC